MVAPEKIPGILYQAKKYLIRVLDPEHDAKVRELECQVAALTESNAKLADTVRLLTDCFKSEMEKHNLRIDAEYCIFGNVGGSVNSGNKSYSDAQNSSSNKAIICSSDIFAISSL